MKQLVLVFEDAEFEALKRAKGSKTWRQFILERRTEGEATQKNRGSAEATFLRRSVSVNDREA
jgi:hypothetical protein